MGIGLANWLNETFFSVDNGVFNAFHDLAVSAGGIFTPLAKIVSIVGNKGIIFFVLSIIFMLFAKTRKGGVCMIGALGISVILASFVLKNSVARVRPYDFNEVYRGFWEFVGGERSDSFCFPSGHTTMITAAAVAFFMFFNKKWSWVGFLGVIIMGFSRIYLVAHFFSDVVGGVIVGVVSATIAYFITKLIWHFLEKNKNSKFSAFCLSFDVKDLFAKMRADKAAVKNADGETEVSEKDDNI